MASIDDLKLTWRLFMRAYPYRHLDWWPGTCLAKPITASRIALLTSAGFYEPGQAPFDESVPGGDRSFRVIRNMTPVQSLLIGQKSEAFDHRGIEADRNLALPIDRVRELASDGVIGEAAPRHVSLMGSIVAPGRLVSRSAPEIVQVLREDAVDAVLLTPV